MPYSLEMREDEWCVIKDDDGKVMGCHASRSRAVDQQRALYANEAQTASAENGHEPIKIEVGKAAPEPQNLRIQVEQVEGEVGQQLIASVSALSERIIATEGTIAEVVETLRAIVASLSEDRASYVEALTAAVSARTEAPTVEITVPEQPAPVVNVTLPDQPKPEVNVTVEVPRKREVTFERDFNGGISKAIIQEEP